MLELLFTRPDLAVSETEYRRLLGYPRRHEPGERPRELAAWARAWYARHGTPWIYLRESKLGLGAGAVELDGVPLRSPPLRQLLERGGAERVILLAVSAGAACEARARDLWSESKPDEYFFLETYGSAVVEHLVATSSGRICAHADATRLRALPPYSPGYTGWDVADQTVLFEVIRRGQTRPFPEPLEVLPSGMPNPKKSQLAVIGLTRQPAAHGASTVPCVGCSFAPCRYRRAPYREEELAPAPSAGTAAPDAADHREAGPGAPPALGRPPRYAINLRALQKWSRERVRLEPREDGTVRAIFRYDGTTCSNLGRPLAFEYHVSLGPAEAGRVITGASCQPAPGDEGHRFMCEFLRDPASLMAAIAAEAPLVGQPLEAVLAWRRPSAAAGCYCESDSRAHKWGIALETIHFALAQGAGATTRTSPPVFPTASHPC